MENEPLSPGRGPGLTPKEPTWETGQTRTAEALRAQGSGAPGASLTLARGGIQAQQASAARQRPGELGQHSDTAGSEAVDVP